MRITLIVTVAVAYAFLCSYGEARVGETLEQCIARYGQPISTSSKASDLPSGIGDSGARFNKNGIVVTVVIYKGTVGGETFTKADRSAFTDTEKSVFLDSESAGQTWNKKDDVPPNEKYIRADGLAFAAYDSMKNKFYFYAKDYVEVLTVKQAEDQKNNLKSF